MITIPKAKLTVAHERLAGLGFTKQHDRILQMVRTEDGTEYRCMMGFEDTDDDDLYEVNITFMSRKTQPGAKSIRAEDIRVVTVDQTPDAVQELIYRAEEELENL